MLSEELQNSLINEFQVEFSVYQKNGHIEIVQDIENRNTFYLEVSYTETRLTIDCHPDKYGVAFAKTLQKADEQKKEQFCGYWKIIEEIGCKFLIKINDIPVRKDDFSENLKNLQRIEIHFSKAPFYDEETENRNQKIIEYTKLVCAMILSLCDIAFSGKEEGNEETVISKKYERNSLNRTICLSRKGYKCAVCGFDFEEKYGEIGKGYIEVHHIIPVSKMGAHYHVDPINDLVPLCANCHGMIHRRKSPYSVEELKEIIEKKHNQEKENGLQVAETPRKREVKTIREEKSDASYDTTHIFNLL